MTTTATPSTPERLKARQWIASGPKRLLIAGRWLDAGSGQQIDVINPATEQIMARISDAGADDVDQAVQAARRAMDAASWNAMTPHARTRVLLKIADAVERHGEELATIETLDNGMPIWLSRAVAGMVVDNFRYYAGWPTKMYGRTLPSDPSVLSYTLREPMGVCGQIIAWNMPLLMAAMKIANALACGNTVVLKPAELASLSTIRLAELIQDTDLPPGVVNIVTGYGPSTGAALVAHPDVNKVAFTGSTAVGQQILQASAASMKKVTLELGGKSPNIIFPDANIDKALQAAVKSFCGNSGQVCSGGTRVFVHESLHDELAARLAELSSAYKVGDPFAEDTKLGPLISARQRDRVLSYIESGREAGATLSLGGSRVGEQGYFVEPTVFSGVSNTMKIAREEIFGPVLSVIPFKDEDDAVFQGNDTQYGLAAAVWTRDVGRAHKVARHLKAGRVWINTYGETDPVAPAGGYKQSGLGREYGAESIDAYTQIKAVLARLD